MSSRRRSSHTSSRSGFRSARCSSAYRASLGRRRSRDLTPLMRASIATFALIAVSLPVSAFNDVPQRAWLRDVAPYVMVACAPFFALDAQASIRRTTLQRILLVGGTIGALGFTARWLTNRGIADLSFVSVGLPTLVLAAAVFAYGVGALLHGQSRRLAGWHSLQRFSQCSSRPERELWSSCSPDRWRSCWEAGSGSRSARSDSSPRFRSSSCSCSSGRKRIVRATDADTGILSQRASLVFSTAEEGTDRSYIDRLSQTNSAWETFRSSPLTGAGPGAPIVWSNSFNVVQVATVIDSPLSFLAKFGVIGLIAAVFLVVGFVETLRALRRRTGTRTIPQLALIGFGAIVVAWSALHNPYEDKGFAIGLMLLLALATREASDAALRSHAQLEENTNA